MIFNKGDEKEAIKILLSMLPRFTEQDEHNVICFAIECLRAQAQEKEMVK